MPKVRQVSNDSSDDDMIMEVVNTKENRNPLQSVVASSKDKLVKKNKQTVKKVSKPQPVVVASSEDTPMSSEAVDDSSVELEKEEDEVEEEEDEEEEEIKPVKSIAKKLSKKELAALAAQPKAKKARNVAVVEEYAIEQEAPKLSTREKRLQLKLDATTKALEETAAAFNQLRELRHTQPETSEKALADIAAQRQTAALNSLSKYKQDNEQLRAEIQDLRSSDPSSRRTFPTSGIDADRIIELEETLAVVEEEKDSLSRENQKLEREIEKLNERVKELMSHEKMAKKEMEKRESEAESKLAKANKKLQEEMKRGGLQKEFEQLKQELAAEVEHSKSLQAKLKVSSGTSTTMTGGSNAASDRLREELEGNKSRLALLEDLTGLQVTSAIEQPEGIVFTCILTDLLCKIGTLDFKVQFPPDGTLCYTPQLEAERDSVIYNLLPAPYRSFMRFNAEETGKWYKTLLFAINKLKE